MFAKKPSVPRDAHSCEGKNVLPLPRWPVLRVSVCAQDCLQAAGHVICGALGGLRVGTGLLLTPEHSE